MAQLILLASQDSYVNEDAPTTNYGGLTTFGAQSRDGARDRRGYVRFKLTGPNSWEMLPEWAEPTSATLRCYVVSQYTGTAGLKINVHRVTTTWSQDTITWNVVPSVSGTLFGQANHSTSTGVWLEWTLGLAELENMRALHRGVRLMYNTENQAQTYNYFASTEYEDPQYIAQLVIVYPGGAASQVIWMMSKIQDFFNELKLGRIPANKILEQYGELLAI